ncbi:MAG: hypothetical protein LC128_11685 [Chitinophagales bacterium]|nr:hypothetical protein [Chitinophagales bacterium]
MGKNKMIIATCVLLLLWVSPNAQSSISFQCKELNLDNTTLLNCDPIEEDDPNDLDEAYGHIRAFMGKSSNDLIDITFPTKVKSWRWTQKDENDKNDSLFAYFSYNTNPKVYGYTLQAYAKDFTITVTRYDQNKGGIVEGNFEGIMGAYLSWSHQNISISIKGNFHTTRTGEFTDECRKQRQAEKLVIDKSVTIFDKTFIQPLQKSGWEIIEQKNGRSSQLANNPSPYRPLFFCSDFYDLKLSLDPNSDYGKMMNDSLQFYNDQISRNAGNLKVISQAAKNVFRIKNLQDIEISINGNSPYLKEDYTVVGRDKSSVLHVPGVPFAWQLYRAPTDEVSTPEEKSMLFFGNWKGVNMQAGTYVLYPFIHKKQSPFIENFVVTITAPAPVAKEIIKAIDWEKLNDAISK